MKIKTFPKTYQLAFDSLSEAVDYADKAPSVLRNRDSRSLHRDEEWSGCKNWDHCKILAQNGLPELGTIIKKEATSSAIKIYASMPKPDIAYSVQGQIIEMGRYLEGEPECCLNLEIPDMGIAKTVDILSNCTASCGQEAHKIKNRGIAIASLVKSLEAVGVSVRLNLLMSYHKRDGEIQAFIKFKDFGQPLELNKLAFSLCSPAPHRTLGFALAETAPKDFLEKVGIPGSYGSACELDELNEHKDIPVKSGYLYIPHLTGQIDFEDLKSSHEWVQKQIKSLQVN